MRDPVGRRAVVGARIANFDDPAIERQRWGPRWYPAMGAVGVIIKMPAPDVLGEGPTVRWSGGQVTTYGSMNRWRVL